MSTVADKIGGLLGYLPPKDQGLGQKFLDERNYEGLKDLVDSAVYMAKRAIENENINSVYFGIDLDGLEDLQLEVDSFCEPFIIPIDKTVDEDNDTLDGNYLDDTYE